MVHGLMITILRTKTKNITITKNKSLLFFSEQCIIAKTMCQITHCVIGAMLDIILYILKH